MARTVTPPTLSGPATWGADALSPTSPTSFSKRFENAAVLGNCSSFFCCTPHSGHFTP